MLFEFIKYIYPHWYYSDLKLLKKILPVSQTYNKESNGYDDPDNEKIDSCFESFYNGVIIDSNTDKPFLISIKETSIKDKYIFILRFFGKKWGLYCLLRTFFKYNPVLNLKSFFYAYNNYIPFKKNESIYPKKTIALSIPNYSIVIPSLERENDFIELLEVIKKFDQQPEVVVLVNQSSKKYYCEGDNLLQIMDNNKGQWSARNKALNYLKTSYTWFLDDDSIINFTTLLEHIETIKTQKTDISIGFNTEKHRSYFNIPLYKYSDHCDTGNMFIKTSILNEMNGFDETYDGMRWGDYDFGIRCLKKGYTIIESYGAKRIHKKSRKGGLRYYHEPVRFLKYFSKNLYPQPSSIYYLNKNFGSKSSYEYLLLHFFQMAIPFKKKGTFVLNLFIFPFSIIFSILNILLCWSAYRNKLSENEHLG